MINRRNSAWLAIGLAAIAGCQQNSGEMSGGSPDEVAAASRPAGEVGTAPAPAEPLAFASPGAAVPAISAMLRARDWSTLARYYDLSNSDLSYDDLASGGYFLNPDTDARRLPPPENELARYRPFHPSAVYVDTEVTGAPNVYVVHVRHDIDQGEGMPVRRAMDSFRMKRTPLGWRILPDGTESGEISDDPAGNS